MNSESKCPHCGKSVPANALRGLCPECLLKAGMPTGATSSGESSSLDLPTPEELAQAFPQLETMELLGRGGMGAVYKARQKHLDRIVALKILPLNVSGKPSFAERFEREAKALAKLSHPNIVTLYESGQSNGLFYLLMEFVDGVNLGELLGSARLSPEQALAIVPQICDALQSAHAQGIVHRDIKPGNILMGKNGVVKIADFGVAKILGTEIGPEKASSTPLDAVQSGVLGTPTYMAPEQMENPAQVDHRADIYALGVVFYQMLTGELPQKAIEPPSKKAQVDARLDEVVLRAMEKKPERRFQQASEVKTMVETIASTQNSEQRSTFVPKTKNRSLALPAIVTVLMFLVIMGIFVVYMLPFQAKLSDLTQKAYFPKGDRIEITFVKRSSREITVEGRYELVSQETANLSLNVTSSDPPSPYDKRQSMSINKGAGTFRLVHPDFKSGLPHVSMYTQNFIDSDGLSKGGKPFAHLYFGTKEQAEQVRQLDLAKWMNSNSVTETDLRSGISSEADLFDLDSNRHYLIRRITSENSSPASGVMVSLQEANSGKILDTFSVKEKSEAEILSKYKIDLVFTPEKGITHIWKNNLILVPTSSADFESASFDRILTNQAFTNEVAVQGLETNATNVSDCYFFKSKDNTLGVIELIRPTVTNNWTKLRYRAVSNTKTPETIDGLLNDSQKAVLKWTDKQFYTFLRTGSSVKTDEEREKLEKDYMEALYGQRNAMYYRAICGLANLNAKKALPELRQIAFARIDRNNRDRWMCVRALGIMQDKEAIPDLIHLVYHGNPNTRWWAQISLVRLTGQNFGSDWNAWGKWWNESGGKPPYDFQIIRWWDGQVEPDKLPDVLKKNDREFISSLRR